MGLTADIDEDAARPGRAATRSTGRLDPLRSGHNESDALSDVRIRERNYRRILALSDVVATCAAILLSLGLIGRDGVRPDFVLLIGLVLGAAKLEGLYDRDELVIAKSTLDELPRLFNLATLVALVLWLSRHFVVTGAPTTQDLLLLWAMLLGGLAGGRMLARRLAALASPVERCMLLGEIGIYRRLSARLADERHLDLVGWAPLDDVVTGRSPLKDLVFQSGIQRIVIAPGGHLDGDEVIDVIRAAKATGLRVSLLPGILATVGSSVVFDDLGGIVLLGVPRFGLSQSSAIVKRTLDLIGASLLLLATAPLMLVAIVAIKRGAPGPALFRQTRVGRGGKPFSMLKLRTMVDGADAMKPALLRQNEAVGLFKIDDDPRITPQGRWLRRTHLDEIPQLVNVIRNEMSLVGPRPLVLDEDRRVTGTDRRRLHLTPGITGQWQILGAARVPLAEMVKLDYLYVANWSLWGDIKILARTIPAMVGRRGQ
jgi:lipopolysaccharide/colanic/teichoic acid biosynthesis glycosyltransferase